MQFVTNGPDVPERLIQANEEGRVVFFCGAGISYPAGLPSFAGLVEQVYKRLGVAPDAIQSVAIKRGQYDTAIALLESTIVGGRLAVRQHIADILKPDLSRSSATTTHEAMLTLSKGPDGKRRLVTTNFDRLFEALVAKLVPRQLTYAAPLLPVPKRRWDGIVYLHGLLSEIPTAAELDQLVISSGDFGLAYLSEGWASRFVTELFRGYTVCFVGYSINDPILRYMMDALAADRMLGESPSEVFAFGNYSKRSKDDAANEWRAKNVTPILYANHRRHLHLHGTLREWAGIYRDGVSGKQSIIVRHAPAKPTTSTVQDDFVGRVLWALADSNGIPARTFAEYNPCPPIEWLGPLCESRFKQEDLCRFGVQPNIEVDDKLTFSFAIRPTPYTHTAKMALVSYRPFTTGFYQWDEVMSNLGRWLVRHLDKPQLLIWVLRHGACLHPMLVQLVRNALRKGTISPALTTLWRLFVAGRVSNEIHRLDLYEWRTRYWKEGLTPFLRLELLELLAPQVKLRESLDIVDDDNGSLDTVDSIELTNIKDIVDWDIVLVGGEYVHSALEFTKKDQKWASALPHMLSDLTNLLRDALDLMHELGGADNLRDGSFWHQPSISDHSQNQNFREWTALIVICRDAWSATADNDGNRSRIEVYRWLTIQYPLFRRMAFFACARRDIFKPEEALEILLCENNWWLWSGETHREALRLVVSIGPQLSPADLNKLILAILAGPPREIFRDDIDPDRLKRGIDREIWLRLAKCRQAGAILNTAAADVLESLQEAYPSWRIAADERDEFPVWMGGSEEWRDFLATPKRCRDLPDWLREHPERDPWRDDDWGDRCRRDFRRTAAALIHLARTGEWITPRWREALQAWSEQTVVARSWLWLSNLLLLIPDEALPNLSNSLSWWLESAAKSFDQNENAFLKLIWKILEYHRSELKEFVKDPISKAINHPVGHVTEAALRWWFRHELQDNQGLPVELTAILNAIADTSVPSFENGRIILATNVIALYRVDTNWTTSRIIPLFDWKTSHEARSAWQGFLGSARLYRPLIGVLASDFLETARHYDELGEWGKPYASLLVLAGLDLLDTFTPSQLSRAIQSLPESGLKAAADMLVRVLEAAGDKRADYWNNRIKIYINTIWPKQLMSRTPLVSESLARMSIEASDAFPQALDQILPWLRPTEHSGHVIHMLERSSHCSKFPDKALHLLEAIIDENALWPSEELGDCLEQIRAADSALSDSPAFRRLRTFFSRSHPTQP